MTNDNTPGPNPAPPPEPTPADDFAEFLNRALGVTPTTDTPQENQ